MEQKLIEMAQEAVNKLLFDNHDVKMIGLENYALDFKQSYVFLGFTKKGDKVILGDIYSYGPDGVKYRKRYGVIELTEAQKLVDNKPVPYKYLQLHTDGFRYSIKLCEVEI